MNNATCITHANVTFVIRVATLNPFYTCGSNFFYDSEILNYGTNIYASNIKKKKKKS